MRRRDFLKGLAAVIGVGSLPVVAATKTSNSVLHDTDRWAGVGSIDRAIYSYVEYHIAETLLNHGDWELHHAYIHLPSDVFQACMRAGKGAMHLAGGTLVLNEFLPWDHRQFEMAVVQCDQHDRTLAHRYIQVPMGHPLCPGFRMTGFRSPFCDDRRTFERYVRSLD